MDPGVQIAKVHFEINAVIQPRDPIDPSGDVEARSSPVRLHNRSTVMW